VGETSEVETAEPDTLQTREISAACEGDQLLQQWETASDPHSPGVWIWTVVSMDELQSLPRIRRCLTWHCLHQLGNKNKHIQPKISTGLALFEGAGVPYGQFYGTH